MGGLFSEVRMGNACRHTRINVESFSFNGLSACFADPEVPRIKRAKHSIHVIE